MKGKTSTRNEPFDTARLDFLMSVDKLIRVADETKKLRDKLLERAEPEHKQEGTANGQ